MPGGARRARRLTREALAAGVFLFCAAQARASHPLLTEDVGVLDQGQHEVELHGERGRDGADRSTDASGVLSYGITRRATLQVEQPYTREVSDGAVDEGREQAILATKWRFFERAPLVLLAKPEVHEGGSWGAALVAGYHVGRLRLLVHTAYLHNTRSGEHSVLRHASLAGVYAMSDKLRLVVDLGRDTDPDAGSNAVLRALAYGFIYAWSDSIRLGLGLKRGLSEAAEDRALLAGLKFAW